MSKSTATWSPQEQEIAKAAFNKAHEREIAVLIETVKDKVSQVVQIEHLWQLNDFLNARRHDIDGKYDDQESALLFTLSRLTKEGWIQLNDLEGLTSDKLTKIKVLMYI